jgi:UDP-2,3-diacylglucosamine pyrophosphatase LpxH
MSVFSRLTQVFESSKRIPIDDSSKIILMSDCHRGDNSWADDFARNQNIYFAALSYYYKKGYTYIEIGDGDELWENRSFDVIRRAHSDVFWLLSRFHADRRLYLIWGNHDIVKSYKSYLEKRFYRYYDVRSRRHEPLFDNVKTYESLVLTYENANNKIFVVHGHQGDLLNDYLWPLARFLVRYVWRNLELIGFNNPTSPAKNYSKKLAVEKRIIEWIRVNNQMLIAGHTHRPIFPRKGEPLYFNTGSCVHPRCITGIEIVNGMIALIKWCIKAKDDGTLFVTRDILAQPRSLKEIFEMD